MATITSMPDANAAYQACLAALTSSHANIDAIVGSSPVDWTAYNAGLQACAACQSSAQAAVSVLQAAILNTPAVQDLITKLNSDTAAMKQAVAALDKTAANFNTLASIATTLASVLTVILKFV